MRQRKATYVPRGTVVKWYEADLRRYLWAVSTGKARQSWIVCLSDPSQQTMSTLDEAALRMNHADIKRRGAKQIAGLIITD